MDAERDTIRRLAAEVARLASQPVQRERVEGWKRINSLQPHRPMLWITEIPWGEFEGGVDELKRVCVDPRLQRVERELRRALFVARHLPCDEVLDAVWRVPRLIEGADYGLEVQEQRIQQGDSYIQSHRYTPVISELDDIEKIRMPRVRSDEAVNAANKAFFEELFGGILEVRVGVLRSHFFPAWDQLVRWTGVVEALADLVDRPDFIHAIMRRMTDATLARMAQYESLGLLDWPHPLARVGSGGAGFTDELPRPDYDGARVRAIDQWGGATAQIFADVSPAMHEEFALKYEIEVMSRCGLNYYGCCEPLHNKMSLLARVPRLRKVSISPWCDVARAAAGAGRKYVFSHKPSPACFAEDAFDVARAERDLRRRIEQSADMPCEIIMKDISTIRGDLPRLISWCEMARRVVNA